MSDSTTQSVLFPDLFAKPIQVLFDESQMSSDGGGLLLKAVDERLGLTKALALELVSKGVTVNAICPTWVDTAMARQGMQETADVLGISLEQFRLQALAAVPLKRMAYVEEVAGLVIYLCSSLASSITGQAINVCGGVTAGSGS